MSDPNANKEKWAAKNQGRTLHPDAVEAARVDRPRLPPGQYLAKNWPRLDLGFIPDITLADWALKVSGLVDKPHSFSWDEFLALPQTEIVCDMHCVTTWSTFDNSITGVKFSDLAAHVGVQSEATHVLFTCFDGYTTNLDLPCCMDDDVLVMHSWKGAPLDDEHGGPARVLVPKRYLWKSAKWIKEIKFVSADKLGYWEVRSYHNRADPWLEERFA